MQFLITIFLFFSIILPSYSLDIQESIKSTVTNNATIKIGLEEINESKELISSSLGNFKPDISISLTEKQSTTETTTATSTVTTSDTSTPTTTETTSTTTTVTTVTSTTFTITTTNSRKG